MENLEEDPVRALRVIVREENNRRLSRSFSVYNKEHSMNSLLKSIKKHLERNNEL